MRPRAYVGVVGPGSASPDLAAQAVEVGRLLAQRGVVVVTGGLGGVMAGAARGAALEGGLSLGLLPGEDRAAANPHLSVAVPTGLGEMRNALLVRTCQAVVAIGSSWGTLSEVALAARTGVPVVVLDGPQLFEELFDAVPSTEPGVLAPVRATSPADAVAQVERALGLADAAPQAFAGAHVLGVDRQSRSWIGALLPASGTGPVRLVQAGDLATLIDHAVNQAPLGLAAVDIPIGLPDTGTRQADVLARRRLGPRASSVFPTPVRDAVAAGTYAEAREVSKARTRGRSLAAQSYALREAILDVDGFVRGGGHSRVRVVEVHPELCFAVMAGAPLTTRKKDPAGLRERAGLLLAHGVELPRTVDLTRRGADDVLDAAAAAWSAARVLAGTGERLPAEPECFSDGLDAAIWV